jgi:predicted histidine transporter YuiF (NhaC family)
MRQLHDWARALPKPTAVLIVSAHSALGDAGRFANADTVCRHSGLAPA